MDEDVLDALRGVIDPELGIDVVDLGLVYRAVRTADAVEVTMTMTTPSCPLSEMVMEEVRESLHARFPAARISAELVWDPPWGPERMSEAARKRLG